MEEFKGHPRTVLVAPKNAPTGPKNYRTSRREQCLGCPSYKNGAVSYMTQDCPLRNGVGYRSQEKRKPLTGAEYPRAQRP